MQHQPNAGMNMPATFVDQEPVGEGDNFDEIFFNFLTGSQRLNHYKRAGGVIIRKKNRNNVSTAWQKQRCIPKTDTRKNTPLLPPILLIRN